MRPVLLLSHLYPCDQGELYSYAQLRCRACSPECYFMRGKTSSLTLMLPKPSLPPCTEGKGLGASLPHVCLHMADRVGLQLSCSHTFRADSLVPLPTESALVRCPGEYRVCSPCVSSSVFHVSKQASGFIFLASVLSPKYITNIIIFLVQSFS